ncbi:MAG: hypothetical protein H6623_09620 [Bdellovibrionaceae bacterium]|nr:hypothetical protein [Pseudobdellovibrionaceae bacterium]
MSQHNTNIIALYKQLVELLLAKKQDEKLIKDLMFRLGIEYKENTVDRLSTVLAFNPVTAVKGRSHDLR